MFALDGKKSISVFLFLTLLPILSHHMELQLPLSDLTFVLTWWKVWGLCGGAMFTTRWFVQMYYSRKAGYSVIPLGYWIMSLLGSFMLLTYFLFGKNDSVGILTNLLPPFVAAYNLRLELAYRKKQRVNSNG